MVVIFHNGAFGIVGVDLFCMMGFVLAPLLILSHWRELIVILLNHTV